LRASGAWVGGDGRVCGGVAIRRENGDYGRGNQEGTIYRAPTVGGILEGVVIEEGRVLQRSSGQASSAPTRRRELLQGEERRYGLGFFGPPPEGAEGFLFGVDFVEGVAFEEFAIFHHVVDGVGVVNVVEGIFIKDDEIGELAGFE
jgi:hypothetical protein